MNFYRIKPTILNDLQQMELGMTTSYKKRQQISNKGLRAMRTLVKDHGIKLLEKPAAYMTDP